MKPLLFFIAICSSIQISCYAQFEYKTILVDSIGVQFKFGKDELLFPKKDLIKLQTIQVTDKQIINIISYTDTVGSITYNDTLSLKRLRKIVGLLTHLELEDKRISSRSEQRNGDSPINDTLFRRVDIIITEKALNVDYNKPYPLKINFEGNQHILLPEAKLELLKLVKTLKEFPELEIELHGHISGRSYSNSSLSLNRSISAKNFLVQHGIEEGRITCFGFQNTRPLKFEGQGQNHPENRRVEVVFIEKK